jgi:hypothetical protein
MKNKNTMNMTNTIENKSTLAKLLATENIEVQENATQTASFDVANRILTIPIFKEEHKSKHVYDMLIGHEVSHALHTPSESWKSMSNRTNEFRSFVNVIEDARIDKLIQSKYPGLTVDYVEGFKKLYADNFFGTKDKDINKDYTLIDKINLWFKSSKKLDVKFSSKENKFVEAVDKCKSFDDVLKLAEEILGHCKEELKKQPELTKSFKQSKEKSKDDESETEQDSMSADQKLDKWVEKQEGESDEEVKKDKDQSFSNGAGGDFEIRSLTNESYDNARRDMSDDKEEGRVYSTLPSVNLKNIIIPYSKYIKDHLIHDSKLDSYDKALLTQTKEETKKFMKESSSVVNYLVKEFEMKKNAKLYARASQDKTGIVDPLKLHTYKFAEDIFKKITTVPNQKNHGMILLLDWSGSMAKNLLPTVEQLLNLVMFCKKINIPFSVYSFMNPDKTDNNAFNNTNTTLQADQSTRLVQLFSHKQSKTDFTRVCELLHRSAKYFSGYRSFYNHERVPSIPHEYYLSSTPLNESLVAMDLIIKKFKNDYKVEKLALVTLTDGASNSLRGQGSSFYGKSYVKLNNKYVPVSDYSRDTECLTNVLIKYLKKKYDLQTVGFFLADKFRELQWNLPISLNYKQTETFKKMFSKDKFVPDYTTAYDVYFYVKADTKVVNTDMSNVETTDKRTLKKMFMSGMKKRLTSRILLQNFIKRIA